MTVEVVYLARGFGDGISAVHAFFQSYERFPPGYKHKLTVIANA